LVVVVRLPVVVVRVAPGTVGLVPTGRVASSVAFGTVVVPGEYTVPGTAPAGVVPTGVFGIFSVPLEGLLRVPFTAPVPIGAPGWPGATAPGLTGTVVAPGVTGTVWAKAVVLKPSPRRAAKANAVAFIRKFRISKR
jgi:hypothetical protein